MWAMKMNFPNAFGFIGAGLLMEALRFLPDITPLREAWLVVMGAVLVSVGASFLARAAWAWTVPRFVLPLLALRARRAEDRGVRLPSGSRATV